MNRWVAAIAWFVFGTAVLLALPLYLDVKLVLWVGVVWYANKLRRKDDQASRMSPGSS